METGRDARRWRRSRGIEMETDRLRFVVFDWGDTLMSEDGPQGVSIAHWPTVRAITGAREAVETLATRYALAVASNATVSRKPEILLALDRVGLAPFFREVFCYRELGRRKDEPAFWRTVLERLGAESDEIVMVGDSLSQDVLGPRACGIAAIWFNWKDEPQPEEPVPVTIRRLAELPALLGVPR